MANKKQLIYREDVLAEYDRVHIGPPGGARKLIEDAPTVDAVEVPPVKIGDTAYFIINGKIYEAKICLIAFTQYRYTANTEIRGEVQKNHSVSAKFSDWNKTVFATKEEAERVLYPCEYCFCETYRGCEGCSYGERKDNGTV